MSIETTQPEIPAQRANIEPSRLDRTRRLGQVAWMYDYMVDALQRGDVNTAYEMQQMLEAASQ